MIILGAKQDPPSQARCFELNDPRERWYPSVHCVKIGNSMFVFRYPTPKVFSIKGLFFLFWVDRIRRRENRKGDKTDLGPVLRTSSSSVEYVWSFFRSVTLIALVLRPTYVLPPCSNSGPTVTLWHIEDRSIVHPAFGSRDTIRGPQDKWNKVRRFV